MDHKDEVRGCTAPSTEQVLKDCLYKPRRASDQERLSALLARPPASKKLSPTMESMHHVTRFVHDLGRSAGLSSQQQYKLRLAVEEIVTNIIVHGYGTACQGAAFLVEGAVEQDRVWVRLIDDGPPFDPTTKEAPTDLHAPLEHRRIGGLGIHLARSSTDEFRYERAADQNRITLVLHRSP